MSQIKNKFQHFFRINRKEVSKLRCWKQSHQVSKTEMICTKSNHSGAYLVLGSLHESLQPSNNRYSETSIFLFTSKQRYLWGHKAITWRPNCFPRACGHPCSREPRWTLFHHFPLLNRADIFQCQHKLNTPPQLQLHDLSSVLFYHSQHPATPKPSAVTMWCTQPWNSNCKFVSIWTRRLWGYTVHWFVWGWYRSGFLLRF